MNKTYVITSGPTELPVFSTIFYSFLLWYFKVDSLWIGVFATVYGFLWIFCIVSLVKEERVTMQEFMEAWDKAKELEKLPSKMSFAERIEKAMKQVQNSNEN
jgi:heme O synthase-like polyprenyltransferase